MALSAYKTGKFLAIFFVSLIVLIALMLLISQTGFFKSWIKGKIETEASAYLNGQLEIGELKGSLFANVGLENIRIVANEDTIVSIGGISLYYSLWPILSDEIRIDSIVIDQTEVLLSQNAAGAWNLAELIKADTSAASEEPSGRTGFGYKIFLDLFRMTEGTIVIAANDSLIPQKIDNFDIMLSAQYLDPGFSMTLDTFSFRANDPDLLLNNLSFDMNGDNQKIALNNFILETARNRMTLLGRYNYGRTVASEVDLKTDPLDLDEYAPLAGIVPSAFKPVIEINADLREDSLGIDLILRTDEAKVESSGHLEGLFARLDNPEHSVRYSLITKIENINPGPLFGDSAYAGEVNADIDLTGSGFDPDKAELDAVIVLGKTSLANYPVVLNEGELRASYDRGNLSGSAGFSTSIANLRIDFSASNLLGIPAIETSGILADLDLAPFFPDTVSTDLNFAFKASSAILNPDSLHADLLFNMKRSRYGTYSLDTLRANLKIDSDRYYVDTLFVRIGSSTVDASGTMGPSRDSKIDFLLKIPNLADYDGLLDSTDLGGSMELQGNLSGRPDSIMITSELSGTGIKYDTYRIEKIAGNNKLLYTPETFSLSGSTDLKKIDLAENFMLDLSGNYEYQGDSSAFLIDLNLGDTAGLHLEGGISIRDSVTIGLADLTIDLKDYRWYNTVDLSTITMFEENYSIDSIRLISSDSSPNRKARIRLGGSYSQVNPVSARLDFKNINLEKLAEFAAIPQDLNGYLDFSLDIKGPPESPVIDGSLKIDTLTYRDLLSENIRGHFSFDTSIVNLNLSLATASNDSFAVNSYLPARLDLKNNEFEFYDDKPQRLTIKSTPFPLEMFTFPVKDIDNIDGTVRADLDISGTFQNPDILGSVKLLGKDLTSSRYGIKLNRFAGSLSFNKNSAVLDSLVLYRDKGKLKLTSDFKFGGGLLEGRLTSSDFRLTADRFFLTKHRYYEVQLSGDAGLSAAPDSAGYGGNIKILRSSFYLPALMPATLSTAVDPSSLPLLVRASGDYPLSPDSVSGENPADSLLAFMDNFLNRLRGKMKISIPRNTWIKSPDLQLEISGDIDIIKDNIDFELFGSLSIVRGYYDLYGRRFNIEEGILTFSGGKEYNPDVNLTADYVFRSAAREKRTLTLTVTGTAFEPKLAFELDGTAVSEGDAVSYLVFGRSLDELTYGQRSGLEQDSGNNGAGSLAQGVAANLLSSQLTRALGSELSLDVIEIETGEDWQGASLMVGKYITNDLFISYQRDVGQVADDEAVPTVITLEYEITRRIFLQLIEGDSRETGFDLFLKLQK